MADQPIIFLAFANEKEDEARYLRALDKEQALIREALEPAVEAGLCEVIVETNARVESIINTFQKARFRDRIAVFHYGGHADGYQLLLESLEGSNVVAHGEGLVSFFAGQDSLQLVFLNGCSTQQQATELVEAGVPAVIGTSHSIADEVATGLAVRFYSSLANGASINRAWKEAEDEVRIRKGGGNFRSLFYDPDQAIPDFFPWDLYVREGSEIIRDWNLPEAVENPLYGLPEIPQHYHLPDEPYRFLERYKREHADIFFGRSYYIRDLFDRATSNTSAPVILFYGQSGVGKSSMLDAGLLPRLEQKCRVIYIRRNFSAGLLETFVEALRSAGAPLSSKMSEGSRQLYTPSALEVQIGRLQEVANQMDKAERQEVEGLIEKMKERLAASAEPEEEKDESPELTLLDAWKWVEEKAGMPLVILLDQVEEAFTQPNPDLPEEMEEFLEAVQSVFSDPQDLPKGKLILSYRKEYNPEIEEMIKRLRIPREGVFLKHLEKKDIVEVITGLTRTDKLRNQYRLGVDETLPGLVANDLLADKDSPIAPVLQILLTKLWNMTRHEEHRYFSEAMYLELKRQGILMQDFLDQQIELLRQSFPDEVDSGLALGILNQHTTALGTAGSKTRDELLELYSHRRDVIDPLLDRMKELYLLASAGLGVTVLSHDTLAPLVKDMFRNSDSPAQRATRILENKVKEFAKDETNTLDPGDLAIVEAGRQGMPDWKEQEVALIEASRIARDKALAMRRRVRIGVIVAAVIIFLFGIVAVIQSIAARANEKRAEENAALALTEKERAEKEKLAADSARDAAVISAQVAEQERLRAENEKLAADSARTLAEVKRREAEASEIRAQESLALAEQKTEEAQASEKKALSAQSLAERERQKALRQSYVSTAKSLAAKAQEVEDDSMKAVLALAAYELNSNNRGKADDPDIYQALYHALDESNGEGYRELAAHTSSVRDLAFSSDGTHLFSTSGDGRLLGWQWKDGTAPAQIDDNQRVTRAVAISDDGSTLVHPGGNSGMKVYRFSTIYNPPQPEVMEAHDDDTYDIDFYPDHQRFVSSGADNTIRVSGPSGSRVLARLDAPAHSVDVSPDGNSIVAAVDDGRLLHWNSTDTSYQVVYQADEPLSAVKYSSDMRWLAAGDDEGRIYLFDLRNGGQMRTLTGHKARIQGLDFSPDGRKLASGSRDKTVRIWDPATSNSLPLVLEDNPDWVMSVAFSPDGQEVLAGCNNGVIKRWPTSPDLLYPELKADKDLRISASDWELYVGKDTPYPYD